MNPLRQIFISIILMLPLLGMGQNWIADTLTITNTDKLFCSFQLDEVNDRRKSDNDFISVYEQKRWLFFPVDQVVKTQYPLAVYFKKTFLEPMANSQKYIVNVYEFNINNSASLGKRNFTLFSTLELLKTNNVDTLLVGTFYYEKQFSQKKKEDIITGYENILGEWNRKFVSDVIGIEQGADLIEGDSYYHFRRNKSAVIKNLYAEVEAFAGLNFWGIDGEIWFSEPEGNRIFNRSAGIMRYVSHPNFQSIAFGQNLGLWNYRINEQLLFTHKIAILIGFNNWKDMSTANHKIEEIALFNLSFTQRINYNKFDKSGVVFGLGLMEDFHYIIYHKPKLKIGLTFNCAYKF